MDEKRLKQLEELSLGVPDIDWEHEWTMELIAEIERLRAQPSAKLMDLMTQFFNRVERDLVTIKAGWTSSDGQQILDRLVEDMKRALESNAADRAKDDEMYTVVKEWREFYRERDDLTNPEEWSDDDLIRCDELFVKMFAVIDALAERKG